MNRSLALAGVAALILGAALWLFRKGEPPDRLAELKRLVEAQQQEGAVADYRPRARGRIGDLSAPAAEILKQLPGVVNIEVVAAENPTHRIIHLCDWHLVPKEAFAQTAFGREPTEAELARAYEEHLLEVELVQLEQVQRPLGADPPDARTGHGVCIRLLPTNCPLGARVA